MAYHNDYDNGRNGRDNYGQGGNGRYARGGQQRPQGRRQEGPRDMSGTIQENRQKRGANSPDWKGKIMIEGREYWINGWFKNGQHGEFVSLSAQPKEEQQGGYNGPRNTTGASYDRGGRQGYEGSQDYGGQRNAAPANAQGRAYNRPPRDYDAPAPLGGGYERGDPGPNPNDYPDGEIDFG